MFKFLQWFRNKIGNSHVSLITANIYKNNINHNYKEFCRVLESSTVCPVLKSNAYGHGLIEVGKIIDDLNPPFIVVDAIFEAINLRMAGVLSHILIIGYTPLENIEKIKARDIAITITSLDMLKHLKKVKDRVKIHLKIDTGMSRQGIFPEELDEALDILDQIVNIELEGICTHFSDADNADDFGYTLEQIDRWNTCVLKVQGRKPFIKFFHACATAGFAFKDKIHANTYRLGLGLYGLKTGGTIDNMVNLKPVLEVNTQISSIKKIKKDQGVGYGVTFKAPKDMRIATIPMGYYEGIDRRLSNRGFVKINDKFAPIIGRVSMNITTIDITDIPEAELNTKVNVISTISSDKNSINSIVKLCEESGIIGYEVSVHFPTQIRRNVI